MAAADRDPQGLNKLTAEHDSLMGNPATTEALAASEQRQSQLPQGLETWRRAGLLSDRGSGRDYERLASIRAGRSSFRTS